MKRILTLTAVLAGLVGVGAGIVRRRPRLAKVAPELRSPALYLPMSVTGETSLRFGRRLSSMEPAVTMPPGVRRRIAAASPATCRW